jgi:hypothetical protein
MSEAKLPLPPESEVKFSGGAAISDAFQMPSYWYARTDEEGAGPTYVVGRGDEEITYPCLFRHEAQAMVDALNQLNPPR